MPSPYQQAKKLVEKGQRDRAIVLLQHRAREKKLDDEGKALLEELGGAKAETFEPRVQTSGECDEAKTALILGIIGVFCFGVILGPIAIYEGVKARRLIRQNPQLTGKTMATAGLVLGIITTAFWVLGILLQIIAFALASAY